MAYTDAQKAANQNYKNQASRQLNLRFYERDYDIVDHINAQPSKIEYIARLVREDMAKTK